MLFETMAWLGEPQEDTSVGTQPPITSRLTNRGATGYQARGLYLRGTTRARRLAAATSGGRGLAPGRPQPRPDIVIAPTTPCAGTHC